VYEDDIATLPLFRTASKKKGNGQKRRKKKKKKKKKRDVHLMTEPLFFTLTILPLPSFLGLPEPSFLGLSFCAGGSPCRKPDKSRLLSLLAPPRAGSVSTTRNATPGNDDPEAFRGTPGNAPDDEERGEETGEMSETLLRRGLMSFRILDPRAVRGEVPSGPEGGDDARTGTLSETKKNYFFFETKTSKQRQSHNAGVGGETGCPVRQSENCKCDNSSLRASNVALQTGQRSLKKIAH
jgi:hypothetical protein